METVDLPEIDESTAPDAPERLALELALREALEDAYKEASATVEASEDSRVAEESSLEAAATVALEADRIFDNCRAADSEDRYQTPEATEPAGSLPASSPSYVLPDSIKQKVRKLAGTKHAARGALLTLALYKMLVPTQDIRMSKTEHPNGFSARRFDTRVTVPFLLIESLPKNVETHWLTQSFSFAEPWTRERTITTVPKAAGVLLVDLVNDLEEIQAEQAQAAAREYVVIILEELIRERNRGRVALTCPKNLTIDETRRLLAEQFSRHYRSSGPRLPQLAMYAAYSCLFESGVGRYRDWQLAPLGRMKAADRKSGTVGDIVVLENGRPIEAVETKMGVPIGRAIVLEAMQKIVSASVERYLILSTAGIQEDDRAFIVQRCVEFQRSNGCEVIVNGVLDTIGYYLRLLPSTSMYLKTYAALMEVDKDIDYEHKVAWNEICARRHMV
ncbi:hypothetical protein [Arthrobacter sp. UYEF36]|uniref:hypothetical protein n=1 Tax=Arthrobacter sp. UYEF36 TaxID=1756366 RepID=UPI003399D45D